MSVKTKKHNKIVRDLQNETADALEDLVDARREANYWRDKYEAMPILTDNQKADTESAFTRGSEQAKGQLQNLLPSIAREVAHTLQDRIASIKIVK